jgi:hypothetical protein
MRPSWWKPDSVIQLSSMEWSKPWPHFRITSPLEVTDRKTKKIISLCDMKPWKREYNMCKFTSQSDMTDRNTQKMTTLSESPSTTYKLFLPTLRTIMKGLEDETCPPYWYIIRASSTKRKQERKNYDAHATQIKKTNVALSSPVKPPALVSMDAQKTCFCSLTGLLSEKVPLQNWESVQKVATR